MRVVTGIARGKNIKTLEGNEVRPTSQKAKESIFSAIQFEVEGARVADLFCGSGQLGIEALSRGAQLCVFVDNFRPSHEITKENLVNASLMKMARVVLTDVQTYLKSTKDVFDIIFMDPPYLNEELYDNVPLALERLSESGVLLVEHDAKLELPKEIGEFEIKREYKFGRVKFSAYRRK